uniref:RNase NYN domain-containing protein n=1 Tax=Pyrodinium bahamense TaxID=73915 RepID=A0A7S0A867_9DINO
MVDNGAQDDEDDMEWGSFLEASWNKANTEKGHAAAAVTDVEPEDPVADGEMRAGAATSVVGAGGTAVGTDEDADLAWRRLLESQWNRAALGTQEATEELPLPEEDGEPEGEAAGKLDALRAGSVSFVEIEDDGNEEEGEAEGEEATQPAEDAALGEEAGEGTQPDRRGERAVSALHMGEGVATKPKVTGPVPKWGKLGKPPTARKEYLVDNRKLMARTQGLGFRLSKNIDDKDRTSVAPWGSTVSGMDEGDGWLRVTTPRGDRFLPFTTNGVRVLNLKVALARTTSATHFAVLDGSRAPTPSANSPKPPGPWKAVGPQWKPGGDCLGRPRSGEWASLPKAGPLQRSGSFDGASQARQPWVAKRSASADLGQSASKRNKQNFEPLAACDCEGRPYDLRHVVVNFANVGASYGKKVLGKRAENGERIFDWDGVRRCVRHLRFELGMQVIGVIYENFLGSDKGGTEVGLPADIRRMCDSVEETPRLTGRNQKSADDEMTIKCAWRRNCRFMDNDNYRDWLKKMSNDKCRTWLENTQELLQMRYYFDSKLGSFDTLDGNIPAGLLAPGSFRR